MTAAAALTACGGRPPAPPEAIVLLVVDCLRADHVGAYGSRFPATPRLDELAAESVVFERAYSAASWTRPSLPSLLTGLYPSEHGLADPFSGARAKVQARILAPEAVTLAESLGERGYRTALFGEQAQLSPRFALDQGFDVYSPHLGRAADIQWQFLRWLDSGPRRPYFAYLHYLDLHWPYCPKGTFGVFDPTPASRDFCSDWRPLGERLRDGVEVLSEADLRALRARYAEELLEVDDEIGRLLDALRARPEWGRTLVIVTSDHGEELFEHGGFRHGHALWEELVLVPFFWRLPRDGRPPSATRVGGTVETRSLFPTLVELTGGEVPGRVSAPSLVPWLRGERGGEAPADTVVVESNGLYALRHADWKLIVDTATDSHRLFDLASDPGETNDLAASRPHELDEMTRRLRAWRAGLDPLPDRGEASVDAGETEQLRALGYIQ